MNRHRALAMLALVLGARLIVEVAPGDCAAYLPIAARMATPGLTDTVTPTRTGTPAVTLVPPPLPEPSSTTPATPTPLPELSAEDVGLPFDPNLVRPT